MTEAVKPEKVSFQYIDSNQALNECCALWSQADALAMDTEFMRVTTFYPKVGLIQIANGQGIWLVDPLKIDDWDAFKTLLTNPALPKIFHSCSEDLLVFLSFLGVLPTPVFDTQIASSILVHGLSVSYQNLVRQHLGVDLPKAETRSDWLQRPLTADQSEYAALDVEYLHQIWEEQTAQLEHLGRTQWMAEECARLTAPYADELSGDFSSAYLNFKAGWQLAPKQRAALQKLAQWRELRARTRDKPRSWIIKDTALFAMASSMPQNKTQLAAIPDVSDNFIRYEASAVLELIAEAAQLPDAQCPEPLAKPLTQGQKNKLRKARVVVEEKAEELGVSPEVLGRKKTLQALLFAVQGADAEIKALPAELEGWRKPLLLDALLAAISSKEH